MSHLILVASGGAIGALSRFLLYSILKNYTYNNIFATLSINVIGSFLIGYLISLGYSKNLSEMFIKYFLIIGLLGSFTTFSAFSYEVLDLYLSKKFFLSILYIVLSVLFCVIAAYLGTYINRF